MTRSLRAPALRIFARLPYCRRAFAIGKMSRHGLRFSVEVLPKLRSSVRTSLRRLLFQSRLTVMDFLRPLAQKKPTSPKKLCSSL